MKNSRKWNRTEDGRHCNTGLELSPTALKVPGRTVSTSDSIPRQGSRSN
jgi:hypothetical protein